jgi:Myb-like DNA-binding domain
MMDIIVAHGSPQPCSAKRPLARRKWLPDEDEYLKKRIRDYRMSFLFDLFIVLAKQTTELSGKPIEWTRVARGLANRNNKDCRKRWLKIDDRWGQGSWSSEEDERLKRAVAQFLARYAWSPCLVRLSFANDAVDGNLYQTLSRREVQTVSCAYCLLGQL